MRRDFACADSTGMVHSHKSRAIIGEVVVERDLFIPVALYIAVQQNSRILRLYDTLESMRQRCVVLHLQLPNSQRPARVLCTERKRWVPRQLTLLCRLMLYLPTAANPAAGQSPAGCGLRLRVT